MRRRIFISGTDTEVGKTVITRAIARALVRRGVKVAAIKPVESGAERQGDALIPADATALVRATQVSENISEVCAYSFEDPVSPHLAAANAGVQIEVSPIVTLLRRAAERAELVVAEGAGGFLVPLADNLLYGDLIAQIDYALVIVAPNILGTINATLLTLEAARRRGIEVIGVVLNRTPPEHLGNAAAIARYGQVPILGEFPDAITNDDDHLAELAEKTLDLDQLISVP